MYYSVVKVMFWAGPLSVDVSWTRERQVRAGRGACCLSLLEGHGAGWSSWSEVVSTPSSRATPLTMALANTYHKIIPVYQMGAPWRMLCIRQRSASGAWLEELVNIYESCQRERGMRRAHPIGGRSPGVAL